MKQKTGIPEVVKKAGLGVAAAFGATFIVCCLLAVLVLQELLPMAAAPVAAVIGAGLCVFVSSYFVARGIPQSKLPVAVAMALAFSLICLAVKAAGFPQWELTLHWTAAVPVLASVAAGLLASRKKRRRR